MSKKILVFDTTLRDGEQVPGAKLNLHEKLEIANQLKALHVDIIEAGFPASSAGDFKAVKEIAKAIKNGPMITALARAVKSDIDAVYESVKFAEKPMIHMVLGTSSIHVEKKFNRSPEEILQMGVDAVRYAKTLLPEVQYSTEDASRTDFEYLWKTIEAVMKAGATMINVPDTVGYAVPEEFGELIKKLNYRMKNLNDKVILSVHCHNDLGLATANTLAAVKNGADKVECTMNGLGERAGNAALEEVVMGIKMRPEYYGAHTDIVTQEIYKSSRLVSSLTGLDVQVNKALTGENAFAHSSGIHQDGLLKSKDVYETIDPKDVGVESMEMILTARSGRHAFKSAVENLGFIVDNEDNFEMIFKDFIEVADSKKEVYDSDVFNLIENHNMKRSKGERIKSHYSACDLYELVDFQVVTNDLFPTASVQIKCGNECQKQSAVGDGPIDALYTAIKNTVDMDINLIEYKISSMSRGKDALGKVKIIISHNGVNYTSRGVDTDIVKASAIAFINGINAIVLENMASNEDTDN